MKQTYPTIAVTTGDPAGIGPEVTLKALADPEVVAKADWIVVGDAEILRQVRSELGLSLQMEVVTGPLEQGESVAGRIRILDLGGIDIANWKPGKISEECGRAAVSYVRKATELCLEGRAAAIVTGPINKEAVAMSDKTFTGHTEFIAGLCGARDSRMLLVNDRLRVLHATTHCSLHDACGVTSKRLLRTLELGEQVLRSFGLSRRRIAVCGLNPHAGENKLFGKEDAEQLAPAVASARAMGIDCLGPLPADTVFTQAVQGAYDLVIAMYHDQGHIPMKLLDFEHTVNVTLGLPIIRTSVDHGTAFDIVGKGQADPSSMKAAMQLAISLAQHRE